MSNEVRIVECPRDAWQGLPRHISAEVKADYIRTLIEAGFKHIDAVSFVSPKAVPQMADSEQVLEYLMAPEDVEIIAIAVNAKGAERALRAGAVQTLGFPYSVSPTFLARNQNQRPEEAIEALEEIGTLAFKGGLDVVAYLSMAFGNPYGDLWSIDEVVDACDLLIDSGVQRISLSDTVGLATPLQIAETVRETLAVHEGIEIGVHLHARPQHAPAKIRAAYSAGCRIFDGAIGGLGGCPFAQDALVGNIPTETLLEVLGESGAELPELLPLDGILRLSSDIARKHGAGS
jgi:hydroxymethylglutaryl-CoA lyase